MTKQLQATFSDEEIERILKICDREYLKKAGLVYIAVMKYVEAIEKKTL